MAQRFDVSDEQWEIMKPYLGNDKKQTGRPQADNGKRFNGVLWILRTGAPWRDMPEYYGPWQTTYKRFTQWQENRKLKELFEQVREVPICRILALMAPISRLTGPAPVQKRG